MLSKISENLASDLGGVAARARAVGIVQSVAQSESVALGESVSQQLGVEMIDCPMEFEEEVVGEVLGGHVDTIRGGHQMSRLLTKICHKY